MSKNNIEVGQIWKSKRNIPNKGIGYYVVEILEVGYSTVKTRFTATEWEDGHWNENHTMTIANLLENYDVQK
jgi:hypothetical protein